MLANLLNHMRMPSAPLSPKRETVSVTQKAFAVWCIVISLGAESRHSGDGQCRSSRDTPCYLELMVRTRCMIVKQNGPSTRLI